MERLTEEQRKLLAADIPRSEVSSRKGPGNTTLDYVEGWWVIARLNDILGPDGWSFSVLGREWTEPPGNGSVSVVVTGRIELACGAHREDVGFGSGKGANGIESAIKEASTDALKRCARQLGHHLGGALYDKTQERVSDKLEPTRIHYGQSRGKRIQDAPTDWLTNYLGKLPKDCPKDHRSAVETELSKRINKEAEAAE